MLCPVLLDSHGANPPEPGNVLGESRARLCAREREVTIFQFEHKITKKPRFCSAKTKNLGYLRFLMFKEKSEDFNRR